MANTTPNYNLIKPLGTEKYDVAVPNANMDNIDLQLKNLEDTKVDIEVGKGLSEENYTLIEKNKVANLPADTATQLSGKVDKVTGKGLSTNDFDNTYKQKIDIDIPAQLADIELTLSEITIEEGGIF